MNRGRWLGMCLCALATVTLFGASSVVMGVPLGTSPDNPGYSAKHILASGASQGDGVYWIDPDGRGAGAPFLAYCDMTTDGGGWTLAVNSLRGNEAATNDTTVNTGSVDLTSGHTRDLDALAIDRDAEIRHVLMGNSTYGTFHAKYTGRYHDALPLFSHWTTLWGHTSGSQSMLNMHFGRPWTTSGAAVTQYGAPWYYGSPTYVTSIPSRPADGLTQGPLTTGGNGLLDRYSIFVREVQTLPEPTTLAALGLGGFALLRKRRA